MQKDLSNEEKGQKKCPDGSTLTKTKAKDLAEITLVTSEIQRYNPPHKRSRSEMEVADMAKSLAIIDALFKKGILNVETWERIHKKYGRKGK